LDDGVSLRDEQVALTRRAIIDAVIEVAAEPSGGVIAVADVARRSGISMATIYRHFPTRDALVSAAANERATAWHPSEGAGQADPLTDFAALWRELAANLVLARHTTVSDDGRDLWAERFHASRKVVEQAVRDQGRDPDEAELSHLLVCLDVLTSAHAFLDLYDRQGLALDDAVDAVRWGTGVLRRKFDSTKETTR
jgi:AcrR family transcriptional regulator